MTLYFLLVAFVIFLTSAARRFARRRFQAKWPRLFQDKYKIPVFTSERIWIECASTSQRMPRYSYYRIDHVAIVS